jgi:hypothetical protein
MPATRRKPPELPGLQRWFYQSLQGAPRGVAGRVRRTGRLTPNARFAIYRGMYWARLIEALRENYPSVAKVLGDKRFARLATRYLRQHPSRHPSLRYLGQRWPEHLARHPVRGFPQLADLARLDRAVLDSFDAPDSTPLTRDNLKSVPPTRWPALCFRLAPSVRLLRLGHDVLQDLARPPHRRTEARVFRTGYEVRQTSMDAREARALRALERGQTFGQACAILRDPQNAATALATWLEEGLLLGSGA